MSSTYHRQLRSGRVFAGTREAPEWCSIDALAARTRRRSCGSASRDATPPACGRRTRAGIKRNLGLGRHASLFAARPRAPARAECRSLAPTHLRGPVDSRPCAADRRLDPLPVADGDKRDFARIIAMAKSATHHLQAASDSANRRQCSRYAASCKPSSSTTLAHNQHGASREAL
jgi:hypothetical protein